MNAREEVLARIAAAYRPHPLRSLAMATLRASIEPRQT